MFVLSAFSALQPAKSLAMSALALALLYGAAVAQETPAPPVSEDSSAEATTNDDTISDEVKRIHTQAITVDTHVDIPTTFATEAFDPGVEQTFPAQVDLPRMKEGGLDAVFFIVYTGQTKRAPANYATAAAEAFSKFAAIRRMTDEQYPGRIGLALTGDDVRANHQTNKASALIGIENGYSIGQQLGMLDVYHDLGARYFGLVHNGHNDIADSAVPRDDLEDLPREHNGLSGFGRAVIARCNQLGLMIDVSHASMQTTIQAARYSIAPIIASHSSVHALHDHARNMNDRALKAVAARGGVVQIVAFDNYLLGIPEEKRDAQKALRESHGLTSLNAFYAASDETRTAYQEGLAALDQKWPRSSVSDLVDHIDYAVTLIGDDHVGIASDFQGGGGIDGWDNAAETINVTAELVRRGYSEDAIYRIWGGNILRVMDDVAAMADK